MTLRRATDEEVMANFQLVAALDKIRINYLREKMGLVHDSGPPKLKCGTCQSEELEYHQGGHGDPGSYKCLVCGSGMDEMNYGVWKSPLLDGEAWDLLKEATALADHHKEDEFGARVLKFMQTRRRAVGTRCSLCKTPMPNDEGEWKHCRSCNIKYNRLEMEKRQ